MKPCIAFALVRDCADHQQHMSVAVLTHKADTALSERVRSILTFEELVVVA